MDKKKATPKDSPKKQKYIVALYYLFHAGYKGINTFEAKNLYGDTCLHSVVSTLVKEYGFKIPRRREYIGDSPRPFCRYWLCESDRSKAKNLLEAHYGKESLSA